MKNTSPRTWICKTTNTKPNDISTPYEKQISAGVAGFNLVQVNPSDYSSEKMMQAVIVVGRPTAGHITGRTFGKQAWAISNEAKPGDRIFLECADAGPKPKGTNKHSTFIVAAGTITGPYKYSVKSNQTVGLHTVEVNWEWKGKELIDYGHFIFCFVEIQEGKKSHAKLLQRLDAIWKDKPQFKTPTVDREMAIDFDPDWREGGMKMRHHLAIERCSKAAAEAKNLARAKNGKIACESCKSVTSDIFGHEIIDAHHIVPLANTKGIERKPKPSDFALLCPTCHRAVHKLLNLEKLDGIAALEKVRKCVRS